MKKTLASFFFLVLFIGAIGKPAFFPSLRLLQDTQWDFALFSPTWTERLLNFLWIIPVGLGFWGWAHWLHGLFFLKIKKDTANLLGLSLSLAFFSLYVFGLAINEILYWPLTALFFVPPLWAGWQERRELFQQSKSRSLWMGLLAFPILLWVFEYLSPPLVWDAILDHFRYAREVSRLHQILFHWTNHTGDMPKTAELVLAGFWNLGGENLSKLSSALPAFLTAWLLSVFSREWKGNEKISAWIFWTCPFFLAVYSWGYVEGFLAFFEVLALYCSWKATQESKNRFWLPLAAFFLGTAFVVKYTAVLSIIAIGLMLAFEKLVRKNPLHMNLACGLAMAVPLFPWLFKNWLAFGNPFYPLATSVFGTPVGYGTGMEQVLLADTGLPTGSGIVGFFRTFWSSFFTTSNAVNAAWTPLVVMCLPWVRPLFKKKIGIFLTVFSLLFFLQWIFISSSFRHFSGGAVVLLLLAAMAWEEAFKTGKAGTKAMFAAGLCISLWLCLSAQFTSTAPYASALGLEDPLLRLKRHYTFDLDTYAAYKGIEEHSDPKDKVVAFAVFQTYPLNRIAYVDFKWKRPIFLEWASHCQTAEQLAKKLKEEGIRYFLYQQWEAEAMSRVEKDFNLRGMPAQEYIRFWQLFMEPVAGWENSFVYRARTTPLGAPRKLDQLPGLQEKGFWRPVVDAINN